MRNISLELIKILAAGLMVAILVSIFGLVPALAICSVAYLLVAWLTML